MISKRCFSVTFVSPVRVPVVKVFVKREIYIFLLNKQ